MTTTLNATTNNMGSESFVWFVATVEDNNDPEMLGRVKIRVLNDHEGVPIEDLLWATLLMPPMYASYKQIGRSPTGIVPGSMVFGFYMDGKDKQLPVIWGSFAKMPGKDQKNNDVPERARGINNIEDNLVGPEPESSYNAKYPYNNVWQTLGGHIIEVDDTPGDERINILHKSGTYSEINHDGRLVNKVADDAYEIVVKDKTLYVKGNLNIEVGGNATITVHGDSTETIKGTASITAEKDVNLSIQNDFNGKAINWNIQGNMFLDGGEA